MSSFSSAFTPMSKGGKEIKPGFFTNIWNKVMLYLYARGFALAIAILMGIGTRERMSHNNGIGARGKFKCDPDPELPPNDFWKKGQEWPLLSRFASATFYDDAMGALRSISIKLSDQLLESPFDLNFNTGRNSLFWSAASFMKMAAMRKQRYGIQYQYYYRDYPDGKRGAIGTLRRHCTSFSNLSYYSKTPLKWVSVDGTLYYVKYRVVPFDPNEKETGIVKVNSSDFVYPENQRILPRERRSRNYLKDELKDRLSKDGIIKFRLQAQVKQSTQHDDFEVFNNMIEWGDEEYPYRDLGTIELYDTLSVDDGNIIAFSMHNLPKSLGILPAKSIHDPNSLNYFRLVAEFARKARWFGYRLKGMPDPIPNDDFRNSSSIHEKDSLLAQGNLRVWDEH